MDIDAYLYDASGSDEKVDIDDIDFGELDESKLLWVDILKKDEQLIKNVASRLKITNVPIVSIIEGTKKPAIEKFEDFFRFGVNSVLVSETGSPEKLSVEFIVGKNFVVTIHNGSLAYFVEFRKREKGETEFGNLDAESFVASLLDLHLVSYFHALDSIERRVDKLDAKVLKKDLETDDFLAQMVGLRSDVSKLRRWLIPHRELFYSFLRADFQQISKSDSVDQYKTLADHFENAVGAAESSRETVLSAFDLYATKSAQLMNVFIQRLTFLTLVMGSLGVIAGILGMNYKVGFFDSEYGFWITIGGMIVIAFCLTMYARFRRWI